MGGTRGRLGYRSDSPRAPGGCRPSGLGRARGTPAGELGEASRVQVTGRAARPSASVLAGVDREEAGVMIERGAVPPASGVAASARGGEARGTVAGVRSGLVVIVVASGAVAGGAPIHSTDMTSAAGHREMSPREGKGSPCVGEPRGWPGGGGVALLALPGEAELLVVRLDRLSVRLAVARDAVGGHVDEGHPHWPAGTWQSSQSVLRCEPVSGNRVSRCSRTIAAR